MTDIELVPAIDWEAINNSLAVVVEAFNEMGRALVEILERFMEYIRPHVETMLEIVAVAQRYQLQVRLVSWYIPVLVAWFVARYWPRRFLPRLQAVY